PRPPRTLSELTPNKPTVKATGPARFVFRRRPVFGSLQAKLASAGHPRLVEVAIAGLRSRAFVHTHSHLRAVAPRKPIGQACEVDAAEAESTSLGAPAP